MKTIRIAAVLLALASVCAGQNALVTFYRGGPSACDKGGKFAVYENEQRLANLPKDYFVTVEIEPGVHAFHGKHSHSMRDVSFLMLEPGKRYVFRVHGVCGSMFEYWGQTRFSLDSKVSHMTCEQVLEATKGKALKPLPRQYIDGTTKVFPENELYCKQEAEEASAKEVK